MTVLIPESYKSGELCKICNTHTTIEEHLRYTISVCDKCASVAHSEYETWHGGERKWDVSRTPIDNSVKGAIKSRDQQCLKCGSQDNLQIDHIMPVCLGGHNHIDNLQVLCLKCNSEKGDRPEDYRQSIAVALGEQQ